MTIPIINIDDLIVLCYIIARKAIFDPRSSIFCGKVGTGRGAFTPPVVGLEIINGKVELQADNTDLRIAESLEEAGVPKGYIALGFQPPHVRPYTEYAVA